MGNRRGISMISLGIMIVVMIAIASTVVLTMNNILKETKKDRFVNELNLVKASVETYITRTSGNTGFNIITWDLVDIYADSQSQFEGESITNNILYVYEINLDDIDVKETVYGNKVDGENDRYLLSATGKVYYQKGYVYNGTTYYTLMDEIK